MSIDYMQCHTCLQPNINFTIVYTLKQPHQVELHNVLFFQFIFQEILHL